VYAYDRIVIAAGTKVRGRVTQIGGGSKFIRARAYLNGNFSGGIAYYPASVDAIGTAALEIARQDPKSVHDRLRGAEPGTRWHVPRFASSCRPPERLPVRTRAGYRATQLSPSS
jgi:hypothetical protein